jgi:DNA-directed RNA polymerase alpha subunit
MLKEQKLSIFNRFINGETYANIGRSFDLTNGQYIKIICINVAKELLKEYKLNGEVFGKYKGESDKGRVAINNIMEVRDHKEFWLKLLERDRIDSLKDSPRIGSSKLEFSQRIITHLERGKIYTLDDLLKFSESDLLKLGYIGDSILKEIKDVLSKKGFSLRKESKRDFEQEPIKNKEEALSEKMMGL